MDLYQELILEHSKRPHGAGLRDPFDAESHQVNPTCGDEVTLRVDLDLDLDRDLDEGVGSGARVRDVSYDALGCSISIASTSVLTDLVTGRTVAQALDAYAAMRTMLTSKGTDEGDEDVIGDGVAFAGVAKYPARVKCALLGWSALTDALARAGADLSSISPASTAQKG